MGSAAYFPMDWILIKNLAARFASVVLFVHAVDEGQPKWAQVVLHWATVIHAVRMQRVAETPEFLEYTDGYGS